MKVGALIEQFHLNTIMSNSYIYDVIKQNYTVKRKTVWTSFSNILHVEANIWIAALRLSYENIKENQLHAMP